MTFWLPWTILMCISRFASKWERVFFESASHEPVEDKKKKAEFNSAWDCLFLGSRTVIYHGNVRGDSRAVWLPCPLSRVTAPNHIRWSERLSDSHGRSRPGSVGLSMLPGGCPSSVILPRCGPVQKRLAP